MFRSMKISQALGLMAPHAEKESTGEGLSPAVLEAIAIAILVALLVLGVAIRLWIYVPHG